MRQTEYPVKRILWGMALFLWMGVIFFFSAQTGEESSEMSSGILTWIAKLLWWDLDVQPSPEQLNTLIFMIRKGAHFTEYAILAFLARGLLSTWRFKVPCGTWIQTGIAWCFCVVYAVSDEFHQMFSDGRSPKVFDVLVDSLGAAAGIGVFFFVAWMIERHVWKKGRNKPI